MLRGGKRGVTKGFSVKAQVAMEYLVIIGFVAIITMPLVLLFQEHSQSTNDGISTSEVKQIAKRIADAAETVYYLGKPSKTVLKTHFPANVNSVNISNNEIVFNIYTSKGDQEVVTYTFLNVSGNVSTFQGIHYLTVENKGGFIWVSG